MRGGRALLAALDGVVVAAALALVAAATGAFTGGVKGYDGWGHLTKVALLVKHFPYIDWNADWYSGSPFFLGGYPPLFYFAAGGLTRLGIEGGMAMNLLVALSYLAMALSLYGLIRIATGSRLAGVAAAGLFLGTPAIWTPYAQAGLYTRVLGMGFAAVAILLAVAYLRKSSWPRYAACTAALFGALNSHVVLGVLALFSVALVMGLVPDGGGRTRPARILLLTPAVLLSAYYYVPLAVYAPPGGGLTTSYPSLGVADLVLPLSPLVPIAALLLIVRWRLPRRAPPEVSRLLMVCAVVSALLVLYALAPVPRVVGLRAPDTLFFLSWFVAALAGLSGGSIGVPAGAWQRNGAITLASAAAIASILAVIPFVTSTMVRDPAAPEMALAGWRPLDTAETDFRVASPSDNLSVWFNAVYDVPQTRGYAAGTQILNPDFQYWLDSTAWNGDAGDNQRRFLLDWYAVKWIYVPAPYMPSTAGVVPHLIQNSAAYEQSPPVDSVPSLTFSYLHPTPIALATNAPLILVIASADDYAIVFRDLSYSDFDSAHAVTVRGSSFVDDYSTQDLAKFDEVIVYGGGAHDNARALDLLSTYVRSGGGLILESSGSPWLGGTGLNEPLPITSTRRIDVNGEWRFRTQGSPITDGIDFSSFAPARFRGGAWGVTAAGGVRSWAQAVVSVDAGPVVVAGQLGRGRVVWSGLNLPFHIDSYQSVSESLLLSTAMTWASRSTNDGAAVSTERRDSPQQMTIGVSSSAGGVLFKESWFDRWHAYVNGAEVRVLRAGPGFMYVRLPQGTKVPAIVQWRYERSAADWAGISISVATLIAVVIWPRWRSLARRTLGAWWERRTSERTGEVG